MDQGSNPGVLRVLLIVGLKPKFSHECTGISLLDGCRSFDLWKGFFFFVKDKDIGKLHFEVVFSLSKPGFMNLLYFLFGVSL